MVCIYVEKIWSIQHIYVMMLNVTLVQTTIHVKYLSEQFEFTSSKLTMQRVLREHLRREKILDSFYAVLSFTTVNSQGTQRGRNATLLTWTMYNLPFFFHEPSFKAAKALLLDCSGHDNEHLSHASENGVLVGKLKKMAIQQYQQNDIKRHLQKMHPGTDVVIPSLAKCAKHVV